MAFTVPTKSVPFVRALFPNYKRREVRINATEQVTFHDLNWSGGSRTTYHLVRLEDDATKSLAGWGQLHPWANPFEGATVAVKPGFAVVETGYFCGKVSMLKINVHPSNVTPLLPREAA